MAVLKRMSASPVVRTRLVRNKLSAGGPTVNEPFDADAIFADTMKRFPRTMAKLAE